VSPEPYERLLETLYDSTVDPAGWSVFLDHLRDQFSGNIVGFVHQDVARKRDAIALLKGVDEAAMRDYENHWAARNVWISGAADRIVSGIVMTGQQMCADGILRRSEIWNDFLRSLDSFHLIGGCIFRDGASTSNFTIIRSERLGPYGEPDVALLRRLMPHLQRAVRIHQRLSGIDRGLSPIAEVADRLNEAFVLLDGDGRVLFANRAAEDILALRDGLRTEQGVLTGSQASVTAALRLLASDPEGMMLVPRPSGRRPYLVLAARIRTPQAGTWIAGPRPAAVLFLRDPDVVQQASEEHLRRAYALTAAEARLAAALASGSSLEDVSAEQGVSLNTLRTHLRNVFDKTGTHRQAELVRLALATAQPLRGD
jgi:DNA-binding CsgD family transcriptional regulator/PAS domain-containing protein